MRLCDFFKYCTYTYGLISLVFLFLSHIPLDVGYECGFCIHIFNYTPWIYAAYSAVLCPPDGFQLGRAYGRGDGWGVLGVGGEVGYYMRPLEQLGDSWGGR